MKKKIIHRMVREHNWTKRNLSVLAIYFILGFSSIIIQAMLIREFLVVFYGNELVLGTIFGAWFVWIAIGAQISSYLSPKIKHLRSAFYISILTGLLLLPLQIYFIRTVRLLLEVPIGQYIPFVSMLYFSVLVIAPLSFIVGFTFPLGCRLFSIGKAEAAVAIGWVYIVEALGSLVGGIVFTFVLIARFNSYAISAILLILFLAASPIILPVLRHKASDLVAYLAGVIVMAVFIFPLSNRLDTFLVQQRWKSLGGGNQLVASTDSKYENLILSRVSNQFSVYGNGHFSFTFPDEYYYANAANFVLTQHPHPKRILIIGTGIGGLLRAMLKNPIERIDYVQLDQKLTELIYPYLPDEDRQALQDPRVRVFYTDGRFFLKNTSEKYDVVFLNLPDPATAMLNRYYTQEFFQEVNQVSSDRSILALYLTSAENYLGEEVGNYAASVFHTLRRVFPDVVVSAGDNQYFFASPQQDIVTTNMDTLAQRFLARKVKTKYFSQYNFMLIFLPERVAFIRQALMQSDRMFKLTPT